VHFGLHEIKSSIVKLSFKNLFLIKFSAHGTIRSCSLGCKELGVFTGRMNGLITWLVSVKAAVKMLPCALEDIIWDYIR